MKTTEVKIKKELMKKAKAVSVIITLPNGKIFDVSFGDEGNYAMIHHTTTINRIVFVPLEHDTKVSEINTSGSVYSVKFTNDEKGSEQ
jgi:hypothetical protein